MPMIAITTKSSTSVKPALDEGLRDETFISHLQIRTWENATKQLKQSGAPQSIG
jgi:hypothetical protein